MRVLVAGGPCGLFTLLAFLGLARAQEPLTRESTSTSAAHRLREAAGATGAWPAGMPELKTDCQGADEFGGTALERAAFCMQREIGADGERHFVSMRTLASRALQSDGRSYRAHYLMGVAQHQGEGNLPKSLFHLERAEALFIAAHGDHPSPEHPATNVLHRTMLELAYVHGEMDHHEEKIRYVELLQERLGADYGPLKAWPLLKLERFGEARLVAWEAANSEDAWFRAVGLTALCAVESEERRREPAYEACRLAALPMLEGTDEGAIELSNAAAAASELFRFDEAERLYTEATRRRIEGSVNPWGRLVRLYLRQGRFAEALSAWREMRRYREERPQYLDQQDQSDADLIGAAVLMIAGRTRDALPITERTVHRPDRQGTSSAQSDQNEAGAAIMDRVAKLDVARQLEEEASTARWWDALKLRAKAVKLRFEAWTSGRMAAQVLADRERLVSSLRPECPGSIELPEWLDAEVVHVVGPGIALAAIREARQEESLPPELSERIFRALEAEAHLLDGDDTEALESASLVLESLPPTEALLRARAAAVGARAAQNLRKYERALELLEIAMVSDPGVLRRLGLTLPVVWVAEGDASEVKAAIELLEGSPLFETTDWGFELRVGEGSAALVRPDGAELLRVHVPEASAKDPDGAARRIARAVHRELLIPNVDITQADIRSLDGSLGSGGRASERARSILEEVLEAPK